MKPTTNELLITRVLLGVSIIALIGWGLVMMGNSPRSTAPPREAEPVPVTMLIEVLRLQAGGLPGDALNRAKALIEAFPGTPEADSAAALIPVLAAAHQSALAKREASRLAAKWEYSAPIDPMTSKPWRHASIRSDNTASFDFPYQGAQRATLTIRDHPTHGRDVYLGIERGQFLCTSYSGCRVMVRFDDRPARTWSAIGPRDNSTTLIFLQNAADFISRLRAASVVRIQADIYQEGAPVFEFSVGGFDDSRY